MAVSVPRMRDRTRHIGNRVLNRTHVADAVLTRQGASRHALPDAGEQVLGSFPERFPHGVPVPPPLPTAA
jgi:hypothetical protein